MSLFDFRNVIGQFVQYMNFLLPNTLLVWSQILPRRYWRYMYSNIAAEQCRIRLNSFAATEIIMNGGAYIKYPDLQSCSDSLVSTDGVHLTSLGNEIFLNTLQGALYTFMYSFEHVFPPLQYAG